MTTILFYTIDVTVNLRPRPDDYRHRTLATVEWPVIPRVGESVLLQDDSRSMRTIRYYVMDVEYQSELELHHQPIEFATPKPGAVAISIRVSRDRTDPKEFPS